MNTLELKHIAPYLPYGLKCDVGSKLFPNPTLKGINGIFAYLNYYGKHLSFEYSTIKPILRPLSDLNKPCLEDSKVPIVEIGKMCGYDNLEMGEVDGEIEYGWDEHICDDYQGYSFGWDKNHKLFAVWYNHIDGDPLYTVGGLNEIEKLFEWHFDVFGMIEQGLAVDINTLK